MPNEANNVETTTLTPDDAFSVLGNDTRMEILRALADSESALSFTDLRKRIEMRDSGQFNYHLNKLEGHFVRKTDDGYDLSQPGKRVVEAVLSGAVVEKPVAQFTDVDIPCFRCGASTKLSFRGERVESFCTECDGAYGGSFDELPPSTDQNDSDEYGYLGGFDLPSAGIRDRTPSELFKTAFTWSHIESLAAAFGICPRCAAPIEESVRVCEDHTATDGPCDNCGSYYMFLREWTCTNCPRWSGAPLYFKCRANTDVLAFLTNHGVNPFRHQPTTANVEHEERLLSKDPFEAEYTISIDGDSLRVTLDADLSISNVTREAKSKRN